MQLQPVFPYPGEQDLADAQVLQGSLNDLPEAREGDARRLTRHDPASVALSRGASRTGRTILLAEDDAGVRRLCCRILRRQGYEVLVARDGQEALELADGFEGRIHLLLTDLVMPRLGGAQLCVLLRMRRPDTKVLYTSGCCDPADLPRPMALFEFLPKPYTPSALLDRVSKLLGPEQALELVP